ncbi:DUF3618 domain-containing protein [Sphingomonas sp. Leaf343]|uniref:DUF3618 domain-containing protein n=1 Tax=Sphingomonas sp. Leaf343 TaxID=1736345 RepID=UPI0009EC8041|nr:DUF3618 domain-containing protein [Sphingomonas sp. Leaf343]
MSNPKLDLLAAEAEAALARERLSGTVSQLQAKLDPKALAEEAKDAGLSAARAGAEGARRNPGLVAGAAAATGLLLASGPIARFFHRRKVRKPLPAEPASPSPSTPPSTQGTE